MTQPLENLYRSHRQGLYSFALSITRDPSQAEDAIQNAFIKLVQKPLASLDGPNGELVAYLFKTVRNSAIDLCRTNQRQKRLSEVLFDEPVTNQVESPDENLLVKEREQVLKNAIDCLPDKDREAIVLKLYAGLTFEQAGQIADASPKTIATRYRRALGKLEIHLRDQF
ncbi:MAG: RNA polymerase sigma factor [Mariniblastus sp.]